MAGSTVSTQYDFEILETLAEYNIQTQINCVEADGNRADCFASGTITLTPRTDVWVEATGFYSYSLPTDPMTATSNFRVFSFPDPNIVNFGDGFVDDTFLSGPHSSVFNLQAGGLIPGGTAVRISYLFRSTFLTGSANLPAVSMGSLHFTMTPVPEPTALGPMLLTAIGFVFRRSTRSVRSPLRVWPPALMQT